MAQITDIHLAQRSLEECVTRKMDELQAQLQSGGTAKDTVAKVAEEYRAFRELTFSMLRLLRNQIAECTKAVDDLETRQRRKTLLFSGIPEQEKENCPQVVLDIINSRMGLKDITQSSLKACHRIGSGSKDHHRPILVRFADPVSKAAVWKAKTKLKGCPASIREFLTRTRQSVFTKARLHFGMKSCWTQDGVINIKSSDGCRHKVVTLEELSPLLEKYTKTSAGVSVKASSR